jgi:hypothetical protein
MLHNSKVYLLIELLLNSKNSRLHLQQIDIVFLNIFVYYCIFLISN